MFLFLKGGVVFLLKSQLANSRLLRFTVLGPWCITPTAKTSTMTPSSVIDSSPPWWSNKPWNISSDTRCYEYGPVAASSSSATCDADNRRAPVVPAAADIRWNLRWSSLLIWVDTRHKNSFLLHRMIITKMWHRSPVPGHGTQQYQPFNWKIQEFSAVTHGTSERHISFGMRVGIRQKKNRLIRAHMQMQQVE